MVCYRKEATDLGDCWSVLHGGRKELYSRRRERCQVETEQIDRLGFRAICETK